MIASVGPATSIVEALATSIGSGFVVGGFVAGLVGFARTGGRIPSERSALIGSYLGGTFALGLLAFDIVR